MMYTEHAFLDRFAAAARDGFAAVEFLFPYEWPAATLAAALADNGLKQVLFNAPPGDFAAGERGIAAAGSDRAAMRARYLAHLAWAAERAAAVGIDVLIEPINTRDIPGYFLNRQDEAHAILAEVGAANIKVQMD